MHNQTLGNIAGNYREENMKKLIALVVAAGLAACGGGGSDNSAVTTVVTPVVTNTAEGFWTTTSSTGMKIQLAILETGETWGFYTSQGILAGALYGNTTTNGTSLSGQGLDFYNGIVEAGTYVGTFSPKSTINVTTTGGGKLTGTYSTAYEQPATLANLAGTYSGYGVTGKTTAQSIPVTISTTGSITAGNVSCSISGTASPRASGKNIFDIRVTFAGSLCAMGNGTVTNGIAYYDTSSRQVLVLALNSAKSDGFVYSGNR